VWAAHTTRVAAHRQIDANPMSQEDERVMQRMTPAAVHEITPVDDTYVVSCSCGWQPMPYKDRLTAVYVAQHHAIETAKKDDNNGHAG
jgi:hypothetical protein